MKATDLPQLRSQVLRYLNGPVAATDWNQQADNDQFMSRAHDPGFYKGRGPELLEYERKRWQHGELYYVTEEMTDLAIIAGRSLPSFRLQREDLPSEYGVIYFNSPIDNTKIRGVDRLTEVTACAWSVMPGPPRGGVWMSMWADMRYTLEQEVAHGDITRQDFEHIVRRLAPLGLDDEMVWKFDIDDAHQPSHDVMQKAGSVARMGCVVRAAWLLMQQPLASITTATPRKADTRRMKRHRVDPKTVRVVSLRRRTQPSADAGDGTGRTYDHRWVVRGHWRKQWYPSRNDHLPIWISPHVKGPDGAPLLTGEKVNAWRR
jgi:hypothetical protein